MSRINTRRSTPLMSITATLCGLAALLAAGTASAQECSSDVDCSSGFQCVKSMSSPGCSDPPNCPDPTPVESEVGYCERAPITCATDADCPSFLSCVAQNESTCWADSDGNTGCDPVDPNAPKTCEYVAINCTAAADCPSNFECAAMPVACPAVDCPPGTDCPQPECTPPANQCIPQTIACQADADCPSSWLCEDFGTDCAVAPPSTTVDGGTTEPTPTPAPVPTPADDCSNSPAVKQCVPPGFGGGGSYDGAATTAPEAASDKNAGASTPSDVKEGSGIQCSVHMGSSSQTTCLAALGALAAAAFTARRLRRR